MSLSNRTSHRSRSDIGRAAANRRWELRKSIARDVAAMAENYTDEIMDRYEEETNADRDRLRGHLNDLIDELKRRGR